MADFTAESIPDVADVREGIVGWIERHRGAVLGGLALLVAAAVGLLAWSSVREERLEALRTELGAIIDTGVHRDRLLYNQDGTANERVAKDQLKELEALLERARGTDVAPLVLFQIAMRAQAAGDDARTLSAIEELERDYKDAPILRLPGFDSDRASLVSRMAAISRRRREQAAKTVYTPPKPDLARVARVETDRGEMKIVFYPELAPKHVEAFVARAKSGDFNGTKIYAVHRAEWIDGGGGEHTRNADPADDLDDEPEEALPPEDATYRVHHARRTVTSTPLANSGDQASRFTVVLAEKRTEFDGLRTPMGELLDDPSATTADTIGSVMTYSTDALYQGRREASAYPFCPSTPVTILRVSIWKDGVLEDGHTWDTAAIGRPVEQR